MYLENIAKLLYASAMSILVGSALIYSLIAYTAPHSPGNLILFLVVLDSVIFSAVLFGLSKVYYELSELRRDIDAGKDTELEKRR